jgi:hypothetical protein
LLQTHHGQNSTTVSETTQLHDYGATGNIKGNGNSDIVHAYALLGSVAEDLATIYPSSGLSLQGLAL